MIKRRSGHVMEARRRSCSARISLHGDANMGWIPNGCATDVALSWGKAAAHSKQESHRLNGIRAEEAARFHCMLGLTRAGRRWERQSRHDFR
jgi:hypothetical protein